MPYYFTCEQLLSKQAMTPLSGLPTSGMPCKCSRPQLLLRGVLQTSDTLSTQNHPKCMPVSAANHQHWATFRAQGLSGGLL